MSIHTQTLPVFGVASMTEAAAAAAAELPGAAAVVAASAVDSPEALVPAAAGPACMCCWDSSKNGQGRQCSVV